MLQLVEVTELNGAISLINLAAVAYVVEAEHNGGDFYVIYLTNGHTFLVKELPPVFVSP